MVKPKRVEINKKFSAVCPHCHKEYFFNYESARREAYRKWYASIEYRISFQTDKYSGRFNINGSKIYDLVRMFDMKNHKAVIIEIARHLYPKVDFNYFVDMSDSSLVTELTLKKFVYTTFETK